MIPVQQYQNEYVPMNTSETGPSAFDIIPVDFLKSEYQTSTFLYAFCLAYLLCGTHTHRMYFLKKKSARYLHFWTLLEMSS